MSYLTRISRHASPSIPLTDFSPWTENPTLSVRITLPVAFHSQMMHPTAHLLLLRKWGRSAVTTPNSPIETQDYSAQHCCAHPMPMPKTPTSNEAFDSSSAASHVFPHMILCSPSPWDVPHSRNVVLHERCCAYHWTFLPVIVRASSSLGKERLQSGFVEILYTFQAPDTNSTVRIAGPSFR